MRKRKLGRTGFEVSELSFGCVEIGIPYGIGVDSPADMLPEKEAINLLQQALAAGINFFDTARMYGRSEELLGKAFAYHRKEVVIATKCAHIMQPDGSLPSGERLEQIIHNSLSESLRALRMDAVDIFMLHQAGEKILQSSTIREIFSELKASGKIKAAGVSTYTVDETAQAIGSDCWDLIQIPFNMLDQRQLPLFKEAAAKNIALVVRSVLLKGLLGEKGRDLHPALSDVEEHIRKYAPLAESEGISLATLATRFALSFPEISAVLVGIDKQQYLKEACAATNAPGLHKSVQKEIINLAYPHPSFIDLPNWDRQGWLK